MISTEQWRSRIGNWNGVLPSLKPKVGSCTSSKSRHFAFDCDRTSFGGIYKAKDGAQKIFILNLKKFSWLLRVLICIQIVLFVYTLLLRSPQHINDSSSSTSSLFTCTNSRNELCPGLGLVNCTANYEPRTSLWLTSKLSSSVVKYKLIMGNIETHPGPMTSSQQSSQPLSNHCKQGIHENCSKLVDIPEIPQIPGLIWLCGYCQPRFTFTASSTVYTGKATTSLGKTKSTPSVMSSVKNPNTTAEDKVILKEDGPPSDKSGPGKSEKPNHTKCSDEKQVCKFFINGKCKYGISGKGCSNNHPRICRKLHKFGTQSQKGCNKGSNCEFFHPRMCKDSVRKRLCLNQECTFMHIRGTKRKLQENSFKWDK